MITEAEVKAKTPERFWSKIKFGEPNECWDWMAAKTKAGYGQLTIKRYVARKWCAYYTHVFMFKSVFGEFDSRLNVLHSCDNPACCNPLHLRVGTSKDNSDDKWLRGRQFHPPWVGGSFHGNSKLTEEKVRDIKIRLSCGEEMTEVSKYFGVHFSTVSRIKRGDSWKHVTV